MSEFQGFVRKQFPVQAARVTPLNIQELAEACGGKIMHDGEKEGNFSRDYIKVRVAYPLNEEQTKARVGDWLVKQNRNFKVYKDKAFRNTFETTDGSPIPNQQIKTADFDGDTQNKPSPASMPKKLAEAGVLTEEAQAVIEGTQGPEFIPPEETPAIETPIEPAVAPNPENAPGEEIAEASVTEVAAEAEVERELIGDDELKEAGFPTSTEPGYEPIYRDEVEEQGKDPEEEPKKPITLDELNEQPGDPRSAQEIMTERP